MIRRENKNDAYAKIWGDKQRALWYFPKWPIGLSDFPRLSALADFKFLSAF